MYVFSEPKSTLRRPLLARHDFELNAFPLLEMLTLKSPIGQEHVPYNVHRVCFLAIVSSVRQTGHTPTQMSIRASMSQ